MQVNRLSIGLQEELKTASNYNTARSETLFDKGMLNTPKDENGKELEVDFSSLNVEDLNITSDQIANLLNGFADEVISVFSSKMPDLFGDNPLKENNPNAQNKNPVFTA